MKKLLFIFSISLFSMKLNFAQSIQIQPNGKLRMKGAVSLVLRNMALINHGSFTDSTGTLLISGEKDTTHSYIGGSSPLSIHNLIIQKENYGTAIKIPVAVQHLLGVYDGTLYPDSNLTLRSTNALTARVDIVPAGADIKGKAIVERYFPQRRAWRLVTAPVQQTPSIFKTWQNGGIYQPGINTFVTGANPTGSLGNGLDASPQNNSSLKIWNTTTQSLQPVTNTHISLSPGMGPTAANIGYFLFVRGDRDPNNFNLSNANNTTIVSNGQLQVGTQTFQANTNAGAYTLIGNPFASPVDFNLITRNNLMKRMYVWDPSLNMVGGYVMFDDLDNDGNFTKSLNSTLLTQHIQSGQAFFVETQNTGAASISFTENSKTNNNNNSSFRPVSEPQQIAQSVRIILYLDEPNGQPIPADGVLFEGSSNFEKLINNHDALKFSNTHETLALMRNGIALAAERSTVLTENDTLYLRLQRSTQRNYLLEWDPTYFNNPLLTAWLEDSYLQTSTPLNSFQKQLYAFNVNGNTASASSNRFKIVFKQSNPLPLHSITATAYLQNGVTQINWEVIQAQQIVAYHVQKSANGIDFSNLTTVAALPNSHAVQQYNAIDTEPLDGYTYYRIAFQNTNGEIQYSNIVQISKKAIVAQIRVFPNPILNNTLHVKTYQLKGKYLVRINNLALQVLHEETIHCNGGSTSISIKPFYTLPAGSYLLEVIGNNQRFVEKIIVQD
ncbi:MAG: hypothetical protein RLY16_351 [Bacteroidota bacterium]